MQSKNIDLYYAFIERCLRSPTDKTRPNTRGKPDTENARGLAGRAGGIAFIMPSFAQTQSAEHLRALLAEGGHVERWIDFVDQQVFPTANNYVALLFATAERRSRKTFQAQIVTPDAFRRMRAGRPWLAGLPSLPASYRPGGWSVRPEVRTAVGATCPLAEVASVQVGIQTSLDDFYLLDEVRPGSSSELIVVKRWLNTTVSSDANRICTPTCATRSSCSSSPTSGATPSRPPRLVCSTGSSRRSSSHGGAAVAAGGYRSSRTGGRCRSAGAGR